MAGAQEHAEQCPRERDGATHPLVAQTPFSSHTDLVTDLLSEGTTMCIHHAVSERKLCHTEGCPEQKSGSRGRAGVGKDSLEANSHTESCWYRVTHRGVRIQRGRLALSQSMASTRIQTGNHSWQGEARSQGK